MSMNMPPAEWFSAANASRVMWIALICAFGGSCCPSKLSTRIVAPGPAMSWSWRRHLVRVVRERVHLLARERRAERRGAVGAPTSAGRGRPSPPRSSSAAAAPARACCRRPSAGGRAAGPGRTPGTPLHRVAAGRQVLEGGHALVRRLRPARGHLLRESSSPTTVTVAPGMTARRLIDDREDQPGLARRLRGARRLRRADAGRRPRPARAQ